jgi:hypothetical protein
MIPEETGQTNWCLPPSRFKITKATFGRCKVMVLYLVGAIKLFLENVASQHHELDGCSFSTTQLEEIFKIFSIKFFNSLYFEKNLLH